MMCESFRSTTMIRSSTAVCHCSRSCSPWEGSGCSSRSLLEGDELAGAGQGNGIVEGAGPGHSGQFVGAQALTYVKSTSINLMAGIPSYFSGSDPYLSNLRLAARSTCDLN